MRNALTKTPLLLTLLLGLCACSSSIKPQEPTGTAASIVKEGYFAIKRIDAKSDSATLTLTVKAYTGIKNYEYSLYLDNSKRTGSIDTSVNDYDLELTGLNPGTQYQISFFCVDTEGQKSILVDRRIFSTVATSNS